MFKSLPHSPLHPTHSLAMSLLPPKFILNVLSLPGPSQLKLLSSLIWVSSRLLWHLPDSALAPSDVGSTQQTKWSFEDKLGHVCCSKLFGDFLWTAIKSNEIGPGSQGQRWIPPDEGSTCLSVHCAFHLSFHFFQHCEFTPGGHDHPQGYRKKAILGVSLYFSSHLLTFLFLKVL